jgi:SET domain-containing protein
MSDPSPAPHDFLRVGPSGIEGTGGFARCLIPAGTRVIEYVGERISKQESLARCEAGNPYVFDINEQWDLDGSVEWNPARFLNHSCAPNCDAEQHGDRIWIVTTREVAEGEELTFNYGFDLSEYRDHPCCCGTPNCVGFMVAEEFHDHVRKQEALRTESQGQENRAAQAGS